MENSKYLAGNLTENTTKSLEIESDPFWLDKFDILYDKTRIAQFFPSYDMTFVEKLNAMTRLSILLSIVLYLVTRNYHYFFIMIFVMLFTVFIYKTQRENFELFFNSAPDSDTNIINEKILKENEKKEIVPTVSNPFMNINLITDDKTKPQAPKIWNDPELKKKVEDKFQYNSYRSVSDVYNKDNGQLNFYQMPSTTVPNDQTTFAKWCYGTSFTCKENSIACAPQIPVPEFPSISTTNPYDFTVQKY
jgi:hypothetical protein